MSEASQVMDTAEKALDVIEDQLDAIEQTITVVKGNPKLMVAVGILSAAAGATAAYFFLKKKLGAKFDAEMREEVKKTREYYDRQNKTQSPEEIVANYEPEPADVKVVAAITQSYRSSDIQAAHKKLVEETPPAPAEIPAEVANIFTGSDDQFDYEEEIKKRTDEAPFIISNDEFNAGELDYPQQELTYFEEDGTLVDAQNMPINNTDSLVGDDNLERFGYGSRDKNIVYVRNPVLEIDIMVLRAEGSFAEAIGFQHSDDRRIQRRSRRLDE